MSVEKLQEYIDSLEELQKAHAKVKQHGALIANVGGYLSNFPYKMTVSNVGVSFPVGGSRELTLNGNDWLTAKQIAELLSDYISKRERARHLYQSLSDAQRGSVKPHPDI